MTRPNYVMNWGDGILRRGSVGYDFAAGIFSLTSREDFHINPNSIHVRP
jgi:hypothetical protein